MDLVMVYQRQAQKVSTSQEPTRRGAQDTLTHFWYLLISRSATVPGLYLCGFFTPPDACGADLRAALVATERGKAVERMQQCRI